MVCKIDFENPEKLPLHELSFQIKENGVQMKVPALDGRWVLSRCYTKYRGISLEGGQFADQVIIDEWMNEAEWFSQDMEYLLGLEHFRFWSTLLYDPKSMEAVISFLQEATPHYIPLSSVTSDERVVTLYMKILNNILKIICRMITNKESETEWIRNENLRELLYSKFLLSVPMLFDMIVAYGRSNIIILSKIVQTVFRLEPKYNNDLKVGLTFLQNAFKMIQRKTENEGTGSDSESVISFDDLALYTLDCAVTLCVFLEVYPEARTICRELNFDQSIAQFYDTGIPLLYKNIFTIDTTSKSLDKLNFARIEFLKTFRHIIYTLVEEILKTPSGSLLPAENFIAILTECLSERTFVIDYQKYFPVANDIEILKQACPDLDSFKADFVLHAYTAEGESYVIDFLEKEEFDVAPVEEYSKEPSPEDFDDMDTNIKNQPRNIADEVKQVLELLPHLGDGFIRRLLERYDHPESAITAILEGNLPPDLIEADQNEIYIPPDVQDQVYLETGIRRLNVYDGDKYDVMTKDYPDCIIKVGKGFPGQPKTAKQLLDDKSYVKEMKSRYQEYSLVEDNEYDDEYDDSYDALADSEAKSKKLPSANNVVADEVDDEESEEELEEKNNGEETKSKRDKSKNFCENPEDIRARYEARRNLFLRKRPGAGNSTNVVGNAKGQGQDKNVLTNRKKKETNKSSKANHNRKSGASYKRNRGMIPS